MLNDVKLDLTMRSGRLGDFGSEAFRLVQVTTKPQEELWTVMISTWHYLGAQKMVGPRIKYLIYLEKQPIGAMSYISGMIRLEPRDSYIGWDSYQRKEFLHHCLDQNRFLICPWINIKYLASHILNRSIKRIRIDWLEKYGYEPYFCETFVDATKFLGTCYQAAGWTYVGLTQGYGRVKNKIVFHGNRKRIFLTIINKNFLKQFKNPTAMNQQLIASITIKT